MNKDALLALLADLGITYKKTEHEPVMTVAEAAAVRGVIPGLACKCLFLRSKDERLWLTAFPSSMRADLKALALALALGCRLAHNKNARSPRRFALRLSVGVLLPIISVFPCLQDKYPKQLRLSR